MSNPLTQCIEYAVMRLSWKMPMMVATGPSLKKQYSGTYIAVAEHGVNTFGSIGAYRFENEHGSHLYCAAHHTHGLRGATSTVEWILAPKCALIGDDFDLCKHTGWDQALIRTVIPKCGAKQHTPPDFRSCQ